MIASTSVLTTFETSGAPTVSECPSKPASVAQWGGHWTVGMVHPKQWKTASDDIESIGSFVYVPVGTMRVVQGGRMRWLEQPLFAGYLFISLQIPDFGACRDVRGITGFLDIVNQPRFVREIAAIQQAIALDPRVNLYRDLTPGRAARITKGAMRGTEGVIETRDGRDVFALRCTMFNTSVVIEVSGDSIEPID